MKTSNSKYWSDLLRMMLLLIPARLAMPNVSAAPVNSTYYFIRGHASISIHRYTLCFGANNWELLWKNQIQTNRKTFVIKALVFIAQFYSKNISFRFSNLQTFPRILFSAVITRKMCLVTWLSRCYYRKSDLFFFRNIIVYLCTMTATIEVPYSNRNFSNYNTKF